jgi:hypothetical protein
VQGSHLDPPAGFSWKNENRKNKEIYELLIKIFNIFSILNPLGESEKNSCKRLKRKFVCKFLAALHGKSPGSTHDDQPRE